ncbi:MAG: metal ABC transporter ATP-binding protein, partial [Atopostipes suicloacalis]|nr:metal ABC transporter ATP-binding protein [Atopostipes suicloacalis]
HYIEVKDLSFNYDDEPVLSEINFTVSPGEFVMLTGENGAAKSTLLKNILGLLDPTTGQVKLASKNNEEKELKIGYVPQTVASFNTGFPSTVLELVESGRYPKNRWFKKLDKNDHAHVKKSLESVGMWNIRHKKIGDLSGGQKQRISLARIFAMDPDLFVLDEPTTGMDIQSRKDFYRLLRHNAKIHNKGILMVSHDDLELHSYIDKHIELLRKENCPWRCFSMDS